MIEKIQNLKLQKYNFLAQSPLQYTQKNNSHIVRRHSHVKRHQQHISWNNTPTPKPRPRTPKP